MLPGEHGLCPGLRGFPPARLREGRPPGPRPPRGLHRLPAGAHLCLKRGTGPHVRRLTTFPPLLCPLPRPQDSYLASLGDVSVSAVLTRWLSAGVAGGEGLLLQKLSGQGLAFISASGTLVQKQLAAGESVIVDAGCLVAFQPSVDFKAGARRSTLSSSPRRRQQPARRSFLSCRQGRG